MNILIILLLFLLPVLFLSSWRRRGSSIKLPPGSLGIPIIGQSLDLLQAMTTNTREEWLHERVRKYGPISKFSLFGKPTVLIHGQEANKLVFSGDSSKIANKQTASIHAILGDCNLMELSGQDHKRVKRLSDVILVTRISEAVGGENG